MRYVTEYEICSLIFLIVLTVRFFGMRKFNNKSNRLFGMILYIAMVILCLDVIGSYTVLYADKVAPWINYSVNTVFYMLQLAISAILLIYVMLLSGREIHKTAVIMFIPVIVMEAVLITNSFTKLIFYFEKTADGLVFRHGPLFMPIYILGALYVLLTLFITLKLRRSFRKVEIMTIVLFVAFIIVAMVLQFIFPQVLLTGTAMAVAIFMMFLTLQNPETMLDNITGTFNYTALINYLRKQISDGRAIWITAADVGGLRRINSVMGIRTGNTLLEEIGKYINDTCKSRATAFRMIGTRFVIIADSYKAHKNIVEKLTERFKEPWLCENTSVPLIATIRYCEQKNKFSSPEDVINLIDLAYSKAANEGFGTTKPVDLEQIEQFRRNGLIKEALEKAIESGEGFSLNYQPLYSVADKKFTGAEALLRFYSPELGHVSPGEFIPVAESTDLIQQIDKMVVKMACDFLKSHPELTEAGFNRLEINLSAAEFNNATDNIFSDITSSIESIENKICFEVTETAITGKREVLSDFMHRLINMGVHFAIDDFGTGYANITQVAKLPFSIVKLDRIFASQSNHKEAYILKDLVNMFDHIGLTTVFEGIETTEQADFASQLGVGQIQGYYYSHPLKEDEFIEFMTSKGENVCA